MNTKTFLSIYQTYSLEKISALNKKGLAMQYAQCEQLVKLRKEMAANVWYIKMLVSLLRVILLPIKLLYAM